MRSTVVALALLIAGCSSGSPIKVGSAYAVEPSGPNAAIYLDITNSGSSGDRLIRVMVDGYTTMIHETAISADGQASMKPVDGVDIAANSTLNLRPGGLHVMIMDAVGIVEDGSISATFEFETGSFTERIPVVSLDTYLDLLESQ